MNVHWVPCNVAYNGSYLDLPSAKDTMNPTQKSISHYFTFKEAVYCQTSSYPYISSFRGQLWRGFQHPLMNENCQCKKFKLYLKFIYFCACG